MRSRSPPSSRLPCVAIALLAFAVFHVAAADQEAHGNVTLTVGDGAPGPVRSCVCVYVRGSVTSHPDIPYSTNCKEVCEPMRRERKLCATLSQVGNATELLEKSENALRLQCKEEPFFELGRSFVGGQRISVLHQLRMLTGLNQPGIVHRALNHYNLSLVEARYNGTEASTKAALNIITKIVEPKGPQLAVMPDVTTQAVYALAENQWSYVAGVQKKSTNQTVAYVVVKYRNDSTVLGRGLMNITHVFVAHTVKLQAVSNAIITMARLEPIIQYSRVEDDADLIALLKQSMSITVPSGGKAQDDYYGQFGFTMHLDRKYQSCRDMLLIEGSQPQAIEKFFKTTSATHSPSPSPSQMPSAPDQPDASITPQAASDA